MAETFLNYCTCTTQVTMYQEVATCRKTSVHMPALFTSLKGGYYLIRIFCPLSVTHSFFVEPLTHRTIVRSFISVRFRRRTFVSPLPNMVTKMRPALLQQCLSMWNSRQNAKSYFSSPNVLPNRIIFPATNSGGGEGEGLSLGSHTKKSASFLH